MHESCGVFGIYAPGEDVSRLTFFALFALQHRGQESAGIATTDGKNIQLYAQMGLVSQAFEENALSRLTGDIAIGHNRYSTTGFSVGKLEHKLGMRASSTAELIFEDCFVPEANRLGGEGEGFKVAIEAIDSSRVSVAAQALGIAQAAFYRALAYAKERQQFGQPIANFQAIQWMLADMATKVESIRLLTYRAAYLDQNHLPSLKESCMAKVFAPQAALFVADKAVQIFGGYGYINEYPIERYLRDVRICSIYEGTDEMQRMTIARQFMQEG
ncbi:acyl-CoA dehydrogenase family protein [Chloroflexota bacterium]